MSWGILFLLAQVHRDLLDVQGRAAFAFFRQVEANPSGVRCDWENEELQGEFSSQRLSGPISAPIAMR